MKFFRAYPELFGRAANFVERHKAVVDVASGVFQAFGHHRPGELLKLQGELQPFQVGIGRRGRGFLF
jgi:hypothetical protein